MEENLHSVELKNEMLPLSDNVSEFRIMLPGPKYLLALFKRYFFACLLAMIPVIVLGFAGVRLYKNVYQSVTRVIYDNRFSMYDSQTVRDYPASSQMTVDVAAYLTDDDFFLELAKKFDQSGENELEAPPSALKRFLSFIKAEPLPTEEQARARRQIEFARDLQQDVMGEFNSQLLTLTVFAKSYAPDEARKLAGATMDLLLEKLYKRELDRIGRTIADLESYFRAEAQNLASGDNPLADVPKFSKGQVVELSEQEKNELIAGLQHTGKKLIEAKEAYQMVNKSKMDQKLLLESELNRLQTHMKPTHPLVISKVEELKHIMDSREVVIAKEEVDLLSREYRRVQLRLQSAGIFAGDNTLFDTSSTRDANTYYQSMGKRIQELRAEKISLQNQLDNPAQRNRFRVIEEPSIPVKASNSKKKLVLVLAIPALAFAMAILTIIFCELFSSYPRDTWKIVNSAKQPLLGEVSLPRISRIAELDLATIIEMKRALTMKGRKNNKIAQVYLAYRTLITRIKQRSVGRVVMLHPLDTMDLSFPFIQNLINVFAADYSQKVLFIDFNRKEPALDATTRGRDIYSLIEHKIRLEDLILHRDDKILFDRIAARDDLPPTAIRGEFLQRLFDLLLKKYHYIFVYGLDSQHFMENNLIVQAVTDCFSFVRAKEVSYASLELADRNTEKDKMHGLFVVH